MLYMYEELGEAKGGTSGLSAYLISGLSAYLFIYVFVYFCNMI